MLAYPELVSPEKSFDSWKVYYLLYTVNCYKIINWVVNKLLNWLNVCFQQ